VVLEVLDLGEGLGEKGPERMRHRGVGGARTRSRPCAR
jgi:hypothetical protein